MVGFLSASCPYSESFRDSQLARFRPRLFFKDLQRKSTPAVKILDNSALAENIKRWGQESGRAALALQPVTTVDMAEPIACFRPRYILPDETAKQRSIAMASSMHGTTAARVETANTESLRTAGLSGES
jgi:hypothetical protein